MVVEVEVVLVSFLTLCLSSRHNMQSGNSLKHVHSLLAEHLGVDVKSETGDGLSELAGSGITQKLGLTIPVSP